MLALEIAANTAVTVSVLLAGRNSVHTWWTGVVGCALFGWLFMQTQLYADVTLQGFFIVSSLVGWWRWQRGFPYPVSDFQASRGRTLWLAGGIALLTATGYGQLLSVTTNAYAPFVDSLVLTFSVVAQILLIKRRIETWWFWGVVNMLAIPLFFSRELYITSAVYSVYLINALVALRHWKRLEKMQFA